MQLYDAIRTRVSTRDFTDRPISRQDRDAIVEAALYAPVGMHRYETLRLTVIENKQLLERIRRLSVAATGDEASDPLHGAPLFLLVSSQDTAEMMHQNAACLAENMLLRATDLGLGNLYIRGVVRFLAKDAELLRALGIPEDMTPVCGVAVGHAAEPVSPRTSPKNTQTNVDVIE